MSASLMKRRRVILVSEFFYPDETATGHLLTKIVEELVKEFEVVVITGNESLSKQLSDLQKYRPNFDVNIIRRVSTIKTDKNKLLGRLIKLTMSTIGLSLCTLKHAKRGDVIFTVTNPAPLILTLAILRRIRYFKLVLLVHDVFPENAAAVGLVTKNGHAYTIFKKFFDWAYSSTDEIITIGRDMSDVISLKTKKTSPNISLIENWADLSIVPSLPRSQTLIKELGKCEKVVIQYAGNLGRAQNLQNFTEIMKNVDNENICFVFRGTGACEMSIKANVSQDKRFVFHGYYQRSQQNIILNSCDIALITLGPQMYGLGVPSKTYNIMASGKPILYIGPKNSEVYRVVKDNEVGWAFTWDEVDSIKTFLSMLSKKRIPEFEAKGAKARKLAENCYDEPRQLSKFKEILQRLDSISDA